MDKVSVIIPVYNVEPYLRRCLDSVIYQTYKNLEIICVYYQSTDNSLEILKEYENRSEIRVIEQTEKTGLGGARNLGMDVASGKYIYFIDSDDWIDLDYIEAMAEAESQSDSPVIKNTNVWIEFEDGRPIIQLHAKYQNKVGFISILESFEMFYPSTWSYFFKKNFLDSIYARFPDGLNHEDMYFQRTTMVHLNSIYLINSPAYHYTVRKSSLTGSMHRKTVKSDINEIVELIYDYYCKNNFLDCAGIPFSIIFDKLQYFKDRESHFIKTKKLFVKIKDDVISRPAFYSDDNMLLFNAVLSCANFTDFYALYRELKKKRMFSILYARKKTEKCLESKS
jgi:glycosyltransferase involved in cell wall biosynthesis